jgi:hypothetical protein
MRGSARLAVVLLASAPLLQACSMFGGGEESHPRRYASQQNPDCARLQPLVVSADGALSRADMETGLKASFKKYDADGSGELSMTEVAPANDALRALKVNAAPVMDWNGDGRINFQEFASGWRTMFDLCAHGGGDMVSKNDMERSPNVAAPPSTATAASKPGSSTDTSNNKGGLPRH